MAAFDFVEQDQELSKRVVIPDTRSEGARAAEWIAQPINFGKAMLWTGVVTAVLLPWIALPVTLMMLFARLMHGLVSHPMPARYPKDLGGMDPSYAVPDRGETGTPAKPADGIFFLGNERSRSRQRHGREIWWSAEDLTTHLFAVGTTGAGKALRLDEPVLLADGTFKCMRDLQVGEALRHPGGGSTSITAVYPQGMLRMWRVTLVDHRRIDVSGDHLWQVYGPGREPGAPRVMTTEAMAGVLRDGGVLALPLLTPALSQAERDEIELLLRPHPRRGSHPWMDFGILHYAYAADTESRDGLVAVLRRAGLWARQASAPEPDGPEAEQWRVHVIVPHPNQPARILIDSIEPLNTFEQCQCIKVDAKDGLFVAGDYIVTHNTETLLGFCTNTLLWGSGFSFSDAKAQNTLGGKVYTLLRRFYRDDDYRLINYITGGADPFSSKQDALRANSNRANIFSDAPMDFINELLTSMLPKADGQGAQWQQKAVNMMRAVVRINCYQRSTGEMQVSVTSLRDGMSLPALEKLYERGERGEIPEVAFSAIRSYLLTGISWSPDKYKQGKPQSDEVRTQHGYLTGQFLAPLSMLADTYGHIYAKSFPEVDMADVMLRRRILVVMIPPLEKSPQEAANLGKLNIGAQRLMMAQNLGSVVEGSYREIFAANATNAATPYMIVWDELGYQFAPGVDVVCAQARSLKFAIVAAGQDLAAMKKEGKEEVDTLLANTRIKISLALEDPKETFEIFSKIAGEAYVYRTSGTERVAGMWFTGYSQMMGNSVEKAPRVGLQELQALESGQGVAVWKSRVIRFNSFYPFGDIKPMREKDLVKEDLHPDLVKRMKKLYRLVRFLQLQKTAVESIRHKCRPLDEADESAAVMQKLRELIAANESPFRWHPEAAPPSEVINAIATCATGLATATPPIERGIALYMAGLQAMRVGAAAGAAASKPVLAEEFDADPALAGDVAVGTGEQDAAPFIRNAPRDDDEVFDALSFLEAPSLVAKNARVAGPTAAQQAEPVLERPLERPQAVPAAATAPPAAAGSAKAPDLIEQAAMLPPTSDGGLNLWMARAIADGARRGGPAAESSSIATASDSAPLRPSELADLLPEYAEAASSPTAAGPAPEVAVGLDAILGQAPPALKDLLSEQVDEVIAPPSLQIEEVRESIGLPPQGLFDAILGDLSDDALSALPTDASALNIDSALPMPLAAVDGPVLTLEDLEKMSAGAPEAPVVAGLTDEALEQLAQIELAAGTTGDQLEARALAVSVEMDIGRSVAEVAAAIGSADSASVDDLERLFKSIADQVDAAAEAGKAGKQ
jgi:intracellular multiplication protein IcmO